MKMADPKHIGYGGVILSGLFLCSSLATAGLNDGLMAHYPFNGNMLDESGNGYDGTVPSNLQYGSCNTPTLTADRHGNSNSAYTFQQACIKIGEKAGARLNLPSWPTYSVSVWFLNDGSDEGQGYGQKVIDQTTWYSDFYVSVYGSGSADGYLVFKTYQDGAGALSVSDRNYGDNQWHHVVVNRNGSDAKVWVDGMLKGTIDNTKTVTNNQPLLLGYSDSGDSYQRKYWSGALDDVRLYDRLLTEEEVQQLFLGTLEVAIDVKPGSDDNCINIDGHGVIPVAILGADNFSVDDIDIDTLSFQGLAVRVRGNKGPLCSTEYSNDDSYLDMVCHFEDNPDEWLEGTSTGTLTGNLLDGTPIEGTDSICIVP